MLKWHCNKLSIFLTVVPSNVRITDSGLLSNTVRLGSSVTLICSASGTELQYKWYHNGTIIQGANSTTYAVTSANFSAAGQYTCEVSNWAEKGQGTYTLNVQGTTFWLHSMFIQTDTTPAISHPCDNIVKLMLLYLPNILNDHERWY